jgi:hypothetical protein
VASVGGARVGPPLSSACRIPAVGRRVGHPALASGCGISDGRSPAPPYTVGCTSSAQQTQLHVSFSTWSLSLCTGRTARPTSSCASRTELDRAGAGIDGHLQPEHGGCEGGRTLGARGGEAECGEWRALHCAERASRDPRRVPLCFSSLTFHPSSSHLLLLLLPCPARSPLLFIIPSHRGRAVLFTRPPPAMHRRECSLPPDWGVHLGFQDAGFITPAFAGCLVIILWIHTG